MVELQEIRSFRRTTAHGSNGNGTPSSPPTSKRRDAWRTMVNATLTLWRREPSRLNDDDLQAPAPDIVTLADEFATYCAAHEIDVPLRIVPDGAGGIVFEWKLGRHFATVEVRADGRMEMMHFQDSVLKSREPIG